MPVILLRKLRIYPLELFLSSILVFILVIVFIRMLSRACVYWF